MEIKLPKIQQNIFPLALDEAGEQVIGVKSYLSMGEKMQLVNIALDNSEETGYYDPLKLKMFFEIYLVTLYTDMTLPALTEENTLDVYDALASNGIPDKVWNALPESEQETLVETTFRLKEDKVKSKNSVGGVIRSLVESLPANAEAARSIIEQFDPQKYQNVIAFAEQANGGRAIN